MNTSLIILFYSQYSQSCIDLIKALSSTTLDIRLLCIDKKRIKEHVLQDTRYQIRVVPTVLIIHSDGNTEKYEDNAAGQWLIRLMNSMNQTMGVKDDETFFTDVPLDEKAEPEPEPEPEPEKIEQQIPDLKSDQPIKIKNTVQMMAQQLQRQREMDIKNENNLKVDGLSPNGSP